jgi:non-ribosomal peptide synthetase component F
MVGLALFQTLLYHLTSRSDFVVVTDVANREPPEIEGLIGFFVNVIALRADLSGSPTFLEVLERVRHTALGAYGHQDLPFAELLQEIELEPDSEGPPFNVYFALHREAEDPGEVPEVFADLSVNLIESEHREAVRDVTLMMQEQGGVLRGTWVYKAERFPESVVSRWAELFTKVATGVATRPQAVLDELKLRDEDEERRQRVKKKERQRRSFLKKARPRGVDL